MPANIAHDKYASLDSAEGLAIVTEWDEFKPPVIFDGPNMHSLAEMREMGFTYYGVARGRLC